MRASNILSSFLLLLFSTLIVSNVFAKKSSSNFSDKFTDLVPASITLTSAAGTNNQTVCPSVTITNITYSIVGAISNATVTGLPSGITSSLSGNVITISGSSSSLGSSNYQVSVLLTSTASLTASGTITISNTKGISSFSLTSNAGTNTQAVCKNSAINPIVYSVSVNSGGNAITGVNATGLPTGVTGSYNSGVYTISGTPSVNGTFNYSLQTTGDLCTNTTITGTLSVSDPGSSSSTISSCNSYIWPANGQTYTSSGTYTAVTGCITQTLYLTITSSSSLISLTSATATSNQSVCRGEAISDISYAIQSNLSGTTITGVYSSGLPGGVTANLSANTYTLSGTPVQAGTYNYIVYVTATSCGIAQLNGTITVSTSKGSSSFSLTSASGTNAQTVCNNSALTSITYSVTKSTGANTITGVSVSGLPTGVTGSLKDSVYTISGTPTVTGTFNYSIHTTGDLCINGSDSGSITVSATSSSSTSISACDSYTWSVNSQTYTASGTYTSVVGCHTDSLYLTITASSSNTTTDSACDSYTWAVNSQTYTASGTYTSVAGCHTETLNLTINGATINQYSVTGGGTYCTGGTGLAVGLSGSQVGISYQLKLNGNNVGTAVAGTGNAISFGIKTAAGTYTVQATVTGTTCTASMTGSVNLVIASNPTASIINNTGTTVLSATVVQISLTATGGTSYSWSNGTIIVGGSANYIVTVPGTYTVTVTNASGCSSTVSLTITSSVFSVTGVVTNILCNGSKTGAINVTVSGGKTPYTFSWSSGQKTEDLTGLAAGTYKITVTDAAKIKKTASFTVLQPTALVLTTVTSNLTCTGGLGSITPTASGGTAPYTITINTGASMVGGSFIGLNAGTYTITLKDANNCSTTKSVTITAFVPVTFTTAVVANSSCTPNGYITVTAKGGSAPYSYSKDGGVNWQASNVLGSLSPGVYSIKVKDANACLSSATNVTVTDNGSDGFETNNTLATAKAVLLESLNTARVGTATDQDWYKYTTATGSGGGTYYLLFSAAVAGQTYELYDSKGKLINAAVTGIIDAKTVYKQYNSLLAKTAYSIKIGGTSSLLCYKFKFTRTLPVVGLPLLPLGGSSNTLTSLSPTFEGIMNVFPNPVKDKMMLEIENNSDESAEIIVRNANGAAVYKRKLNLFKNRQVLEIFVNTLPRGFYVCQLVKASGTKSVKFLKD